MQLHTVVIIYNLTESGIHLTNFCFLFCLLYFHKLSGVKDFKCLVCESTDHEAMGFGINLFSQANLLGK
jgi:hypothetical protein